MTDPTSIAVVVLCGLCAVLAASAVYWHRRYVNEAALLRASCQVLAASSTMFAVEHTRAERLARLLNNALIQVTARDERGRFTKVSL